MKANQVGWERLLKDIPREKWSIGWEAIMDATQKDIDFEHVRAMVSYIKRYIWVTEFNENYYIRRTKARGTEYIKKSVSITDAETIYGLRRDCIEREIEILATIEDESSTDSFDEIMIMHDIERLGVPKQFIKQLLRGEKIVKSRLTKEETQWIKKITIEYIER